MEVLRRSLKGRSCRPLPAIARHVADTYWNGWTFFGLKGERTAA
jgi:hypothetical protein